jgi:hypothetical protein
VSDFGPMATQTSKLHSSAVGCDFLNSYEGAPAMRGNKVPRYGKGVTSSGAALYPKILRIGDDLPAGALLPGGGDLAGRSGELVWGCLPSAA